MRSKKRELVQYMPALAIRPTYSVGYYVRADGLPPSRIKSAYTPIKKSGDLGKKGAKKIRNAVNWMLLFSHKKTVYSKKENKRFSFVLNFITLTLSEKQKHPDTYITKHMLQPFLKWLGRNYAKMYIWKAETQANGNIHYHITTNTFIHWRSIRRKWNAIQSRHGYLKSWTEGNVRNDPNSTDVHSVKNEKETAKYMAKYMTKNDDSRRKVEGRIWGCSESLSNIKLYITPHDYSFEECAEFIEKISDMKQLDFSTLYIHPNLKYMKAPGAIRERLTELYNERKKVIAQQKFFTIESFN